MAHVKYQIKIETPDNEYHRNSYGETEIDINKIKEIEKKCFEWGYDINALIAFFLENLKTEDLEDLLSTMDHYTERHTE